MDNEQKAERPQRFTPEPWPGMRLVWWTLCTKQAAARYAADVDGHTVPALGKCSIVAYAASEAAARGLDLSVIGNPRDPRARNSYGRKLYVIAHYVKDNA